MVLEKRANLCVSEIEKGEVFVFDEFGEDGIVEPLAAVHIDMLEL